MHNWFECKVSYEKMMENGMQKKVTESYLVDALSFTEAEARIIKEVTPFVEGDFTVADIKRAKISEAFFNEDGDKFYKFRVAFITLDEKSGAEKRTKVSMLVQAGNMEDAAKALSEGMKSTMADYIVCTQTETTLMDVFPFSAESDKKESNE